jgi:hypothetical protein
MILGPDVTRQAERNARTTMSERVRASAARYPALAASMIALKLALGRMTCTTFASSGI